MSDLIDRFSELVFANEIETIRKIPFSYSVADELLNKFNALDSLTVKEALFLSEAERRVLFELTSQYVMLFTLNERLQFPHDFLSGTTDLQLGESLLKYFAEGRFPYPGLLPQ